jgi:hypothetical protein
MVIRQNQSMGTARPEGHNLPSRAFLDRAQCQSAVVARDKKTTRRKATADKGEGKAKSRKVYPPASQNVLYAAMLKRIAALEKTIAKLPTPSSEEIAEVKNEIAKLRALPPVPTRLPTDAVRAQAKLRKNGEQILSSLATQVVSASLKVAVKERWASYGHELITTAQSVGEWIANSPTP